MTRQTVITVEHRPPAALAELIERVPFGSSGLRYRRLDAGRQLQRFRDPTFITARRGKQLIGTYVIDRRLLSDAAREVVGFYRGLLVVDPSCQGQGVGQRLTTTGFDWIKRQSEEARQPVLTYGCIDTKNERSLRVLKQRGAESLGGLCRVMMYSQWPREARVDHVIRPVAGRTTEALVRQTFTDCRWRDVSHATSESMALLIDDELCACARVSRSRWCIEDMGRVLGLTDRWLIRPFPVARRRFDASRFECLQLSDVGLKPGREAHWPGFVRALLARQGLHFAMLFADPNSDLHGRLRRIGLMGRLIHGTEPDVQVMGRWIGRGASAQPPLETGSSPLALVPVDL